MKRYEVVERVCKSKKIIEIVCDICHQVFICCSGYEFATTEISYEKGHDYPGYSESTKYTIDICPKCFEEKLIPWIESFGGKPTIEKIDE